MPDMTAKCSAMAVQPDIHGGPDIAGRHAEVVGQQVGRSGGHDGQVDGVVGLERHQRVDTTLHGAVPAPHEHGVDALVDELRHGLGRLLALVDLYPEGVRESLLRQQGAQLGQPAAYGLAFVCQYADRAHAAALMPWLSC
jgi:hypothetical protein